MPLLTSGQLRSPFLRTAINWSASRPSRCLFIRASQPLAQVASRISVRQQASKLTDTCKDCEGKGFLPPGGHHKKNPLTLARIVGSKWTARQTVLGWRHFEVKERKSTSYGVYALLMSTVDPTAELWKVDLQELSTGSRQICKVCQGTGLVDSSL